MISISFQFNCDQSVYVFQQLIDVSIVQLETGHCLGLSGKTNVFAACAVLLHPLLVSFAPDEGKLLHLLQ